MNESSTPDQVSTLDIPLLLQSVNSKLDIICTVLIYGLIIALSVGVVYLLYRFIIRFIP